MKTFKQLIDEAKFEVELPKDDGWACVINKDDVLDLVLEWLTQKRQELPEMADASTPYYKMGKMHQLDELLAELKQ